MIRLLFRPSFGYTSHTGASNLISAECLCLSASLTGAQNVTVPCNSSWKY